MSSNPSSGVDLNPSGLILPAYVLLRPDGVFIKISPPPAQDILQLFVDRLFLNECRFSGLDYAAFIKLLYHSDSIEQLDNDSAEVRIANSIVRFPKHRLALYRGLKTADSGDSAEYMFEPVFVEVVKEEPIYGEPDENGIMPIIDHRKSVQMHPTKLDFDEFVAGLWLNGVRFGLNADVVNEALKNKAYARITIARQLEPTPSKDAEIVEESDTLRQDNAPMILANGKADLRRARNRFPQVVKNVPLLRKVPRQLGKPGYCVTGVVIEPRIPLDIDLSKLAGEGTRIDQSPKGELLVADLDGFVVLDEQTSEIFVTTKIENKSGISAKSTGDILLSVDHYTEHGEVQEGRIVEGKHMTFLSDVHGIIKSQDGSIELEKNISGGSAQSVGGNITIKGKAINATLEAWDGNISIEFAESSIITGKFVSIERAVNCEIIAEELQLGIAEGCAIAGKNIQITTSASRKNRETIISMLLPDLESYDRQIAQEKAQLLKVEQAIQARTREITATQSDPGFAKYLAIAEKVRTGVIKFSPEQQTGWQKLVNQYAPLFRGSEGLIKKRQALDEAIQQLTQERIASAKAEDYCKIAEIHGETLVRKLTSNLGVDAFRGMPQPELRAKLNELGTAEERILSGHKGSLDWHYKTPGNPASQS
jgi:hypothetical protein